MFKGGNYRSNEVRTCEGRSSRLLTHGSNNEVFRKTGIAACSVRSLYVRVTTSLGPRLGAIVGRKECENVFVRNRRCPASRDRPRCRSRLEIRTGLVQQGA